MEIKVICPCGAKYRFPVEPVQGALPQPIACPVCGLDNTELGNQAIQTALGVEASSEYPVAAIPERLRLSSAARAPEASQAPPSPALPPLPPARAVSRPAMPASRPVQRGSGGKAKKWMAAAGGAVLVLFGLWVVYNKVVKTVLTAVDIAQAIQEGDAEWADVHWTLPDDSSRVLLFKADNHTNVAGALVQATHKLRRPQLQVEGTTEAYEENAEFFVLPPHNGVVQVRGFWNWEEPQISNVAAAFSTQFQTPVVMALMGDDAEAGVYAVFDEGERKFWMKRWYQIVSLSEDGLKEFVERDGDEWATAKGYVPDPTNLLDTEFYAFHDANELTLKLGIDVSDMDYDQTNVLVLKPVTGPGR